MLPLMVVQPSLTVNERIRRQLAKACELMVVMVDGSVTWASAVSQKAFDAIVCRPSGSVTLDSDVQLANVLLLMEVSEEGKSMLASDVQPLKALVPIEVSEEGIAMLASDEQP
jgi:hypothetical protein